MHDLNFMPWRENKAQHKKINQLKRPMGLLLLLMAGLGLAHHWLNHLCDQYRQKNNQIQRSIQQLATQDTHYQQLIQRCWQLQQSLGQLLQYHLERYQLNTLLNNIFLKWPSTITLKSFQQLPHFIRLEIVVPTQTSVNDWIAQLRQLPAVKNVRTTIVTAASNTTVMRVTLILGDSHDDLQI